MVQMVGVGEETGNLDNTLDTVAQSYEVEADDRTGSAVGLIQPAMTIAIAIVVGFIAISMVLAMYSIYNQVQMSLGAKRNVPTEFPVSNGAHTTNSCTKIEKPHSCFALGDPKEVV